MDVSSSGVLSDECGEDVVVVCHPVAGFGWDEVADVVGGEFAAGSDEFREGGFDVVGVVVVSDCCGCEGGVLPVQPELLTSRSHFQFTVPVSMCAFTPYNFSSRTRL